MKKAKKERGPRRIHAKYCWLVIDPAYGKRELNLRTASGTLTTIVLPDLDLGDLNCAIGQLKSLRWHSQRAARSARTIADAMTCDLEAT